jgi:transposase
LPESSARWKELAEKFDNTDHAQIVERQVNHLDEQTLHSLYSGVGSLAYDPVPMLKMVLYQYLKKHASPAQWHEEAKLNEAMQWLGRGYQPARRTWYDFRDRVGAVIDQLHEQLIHRAIDQEHLDPSVGVQDGTFFAACASRHRMVNQGTLEKRQLILSQVIGGELSGDEEEIPKWVPPTLDGRLDLAGRIDKAAEILSTRIAQNATKPSGNRKDPAKIVVSLSDPEAPLGRDKLKVYRPLYTVQYMIEPASNLVMSYCCEASASDTGTLAPMIDLTQNIVGDRLRTVMADAAYCTILDLQDCMERNIELLAPVQSNSFTEAKKKLNGSDSNNREQFAWDEAEQTYHCPAGHKLDYKGKERKSRHNGRSVVEHRYHCSPSHCEGCPLANGCVRNESRGRTNKRLEGQDLLDAQREKMDLEEVKNRYQLRGQTVERGFADAKGNRQFHRYHGRGLSRARTETGLLVLAQNLLILDRLQRNVVNTDKNET